MSVEWIPQPFKPGKHSGAEPSSFCWNPLKTFPTFPRNPIRVGIPQVFHSIRARALQVPGGWASRQNKWFAWEPLPQGWSHSCSLLPTSNILEPSVIFNHHLFIGRLQTVHQVGKEMAPPLPRERVHPTHLRKESPRFSTQFGPEPYKSLAGTLHGFWDPQKTFSDANIFCWDPWTWNRGKHSAIPERDL